MDSLRVTFRIDFNDGGAVGPGKIALLERMRETGSLSQAARDLDMSYRRAWQLLDSLNQMFREPVVVTSVGGKGGGGATLTALGESLIASYREIERDITVHATRRLESFGARIAKRKAGLPRRALSKSASPARAAAKS